MRVNEILEQLVTVQHQTRALLGQVNALIRELAPAAEEEMRQEQSKQDQLPRTFGKKE